MPILTAENINFNNIISYAQIEINPQVTTFISGESGCGKSTLLRLLNRSISANSGDIYYDNVNIKNIDTIKLRREIMLVSQTVFLFDTTIEKNFTEFYSYRGEKPATIEKMNEFLELCNVKFPLDTLCTTMSGGERQRIYTAIFMSFMPKIIMLDEPTSALDLQNAEIVLNNIKTFCYENKMTLIVVSHDDKLKEKFADEIVTIERVV